MYSPISAECHDVPQAVMTIRSTCLNSSSLRLRPETREVPSSSRRWPRSVLQRLSGCSQISLSMKCGKPLRSTIARSQSIWFTGLLIRIVWRFRTR